ncbi:hypothetical protein HDU92_008991 [Lobulomyces angularis]|nr:hypothetical protein HDU92_008991 [Lobulomyces angularis]
MKSFYFLSLLCLTSAKAIQKNPLFQDLTFNNESIVYSGNGCPLNSASINFNSDNTAFTLLFDKMIAVLAPGIPEIENVKNCKIDVILNIPKGWQFTLTTFDYRGFLDLSKKVKGKQVSAAFFKDKSIINEKDLQSQETLFDSLSNGDYTIRDSFAFNSWSRCGLKAKLNIDTKIKLRSLAGAGETAQGLITVDSLDSKVSNRYNLLWRTYAIKKLDYSKSTVPG